MSNNKQQTTVDWIEQEMLKGNLSLKQILIQAREMEKEEIKEAWDNAAIDATYGNKFRNFEHYYNETYGGNK